MVLKVKTVVTLAVGSDQKGAVGRFWGCWLCLDLVAGYILMFNF